MNDTKHTKLCDNALEHYKELAKSHFSKTVIDAIEFYKYFGKENLEDEILKAAASIQGKRSTEKIKQDPEYIAKMKELEKRGAAKQWSV